MLFLSLVPLAAGVKAQNPSPSSQQNPTVTFSTPGDYNVTFQSFNATGSSNIVTKRVTVLNPTPQIVTMTTLPSVVGLNLPVILQDTATGRPPLTPRWKFTSDVLPDFTLTGNPVIWFPVVGHYQVHLEVSTNVAADGTASSPPVPVSVVLFSFADVPPSYWAWHFIEGLQAAGVPAACGTNPLQYCPDSAMTRGDMALFLLRSKEGGAYAPPPCLTATFTDVPCSDSRAPWINELVRRGVTAGCGGGNYCPGNPVTRDQMAVFLLVTAGVAGDPTCPPAPFTDVPCSTPFEPFIKKLVSLGVTAGCGSGAYCPQSTVTRAQMAVFLSVMFHIPTV